MADIIISAPLGSTGYTINAPTGTIGAYLSDPANAGLAVSLSTTATTRLLTSMGRGNGTTVWRLRNGTANNVDATLSAYGGGFSQQYSLLSGTDTFVASTFTAGSATHILSFPSFSSTKAAGNQAVSSIYTPQETDIFVLQGASGDDILNGGSRADRLIGNAGNDTLTGNGGADTLTGGMGADTFVFNPNLNDPLFTDTVIDFNPSDGDVFAFNVNSFTGDPLEGTPAIVGSVEDALANSENDVAQYIIVDEIANISSLIETATFGSISFAYATDTRELLYSSGGFSTTPFDIIAQINTFTGTLTADNFTFVA
jgi:Ca2+-binding RTX toxin-like protein